MYNDRTQKRIIAALRDGYFNIRLDTRPGICVQSTIENIAHNAKHIVSDCYHTAGRYLHVKWVNNKVYSTNTTNNKKENKMTTDQRKKLIDLYMSEGQYKDMSVGNALEYLNQTYDLRISCKGIDDVTEAIENDDSLISWAPSS